MEIQNYNSIKSRPIRDKKPKKNNLSHKILLAEFLSNKFMSKIKCKSKVSIGRIHSNVKKVFIFFLDCKVYEVILAVSENSNNEFDFEFITLPNFYKNDDKISKMQNLLYNKSKKSVQIISLSEFYSKNLKNIYI